MNYFKSQLLNIDNDTLKINSEGKLYAEIQTSDELIDDENSSSSTTYSSNKINELIPVEYELPTASSSILGGVKVDGTTIHIDNNGIISAEVSGTSELNDLDDVSLSNLNNNQILSYDGTSHRWINKNFSEYELPIASTSTLGGVKVDGTTIDIDNNGVISYQLPKASNVNLGGVIVDNDTIIIDNNGVISATAQEITVDDTLNPTSENPVQNKILYEIFGNIENDIEEIRDDIDSIEIIFGDDVFMSSEEIEELFNTENDEEYSI